MIDVVSEAFFFFHTPKGCQVFSRNSFFILSSLFLSVVVFITHNVVVYDNPWHLLTHVGHGIDVDSSLLHRGIDHLCLGGGVSIGGGWVWRLSIDDGLVQRLLLRQRSHRQQCVALVILIHLEGVLSLDGDETLVTDHWRYPKLTFDWFGMWLDSHTHQS